MVGRGVWALAWLGVRFLVCQPVGAQIFRPPDNAVAFDSSTVTVTGTAERYVPADRAVLYLEIVSRGATPEAAALANGTSRSAVTSRVADLGVELDGIGLWGFGAGTAKSDFGPPRGGPEEAFEARSGLRVELASLERLDPVVSTSLLAGASVARVELHAADRSILEEEAIAEAVRRARSTAEAMAEAAGGRLGPLLSIASGNVPSASYWVVPYDGRPEGDWVSLDRSQTTVRAVVQVTWVYDPSGT